MSRRQRTTITFSVRLPLPPGATAPAAAIFLKEAIENLKKATPNKFPMASIEPNSINIKIINRETIYL